MLGWQPLPEAAMLRLAWPPWFTQRLWKWLHSLGWAETAPRTDSLRGITYLELLLNFIAEMQVLPPLLRGRSGRGTYVSLLHGEGRLSSFTVQELLLTFVAAVKALTRVTGHKLLPTAPHHRIRTLAMFPAEANGRKGLLDRPSFGRQQLTYELLSQFLEQKSAECLRQFCLRSGLSSAEDPVLAARWLAAAASRRRTAMGRGV